MGFLDRAFRISERGSTLGFPPHFAGARPALRPRGAGHVTGRTQTEAGQTWSKAGCS